MQPDSQSAPPPDPSAAASSASDAASSGPDAVGQSIATGLDTVGNSFQHFANDPSLENALRLFGPMLVDLGIAILGLIVLLIVVSIVGRWAQKLARIGLARLKLEETVVRFLARTAKYAIWVLAVPIALELFGVRTTSIATVIGATGLAIGLAMQGSLSHIAAGLMLLILRPFRIGDWVELDDEFGVVDDIGIFYTRVNTFSNKLILLPNAEVLGAKIEHFTANQFRRVDVPIGVAYGTDLEHAQRVLEEAAEKVSAETTDHKEPAVILTAFGPSSIDFEVRVWCESTKFLDARTATIHAINRALADADIEIPFPQRTLTFANAIPVRQDTRDTPQHRPTDAPHSNDT